MDIVERLEKLIALMNDNGLSEMEIETEESKIRLKKPGPAALTMPTSMPMNFSMPVQMPSTSMSRDAGAPSHHPAHNPARGIVEGDSRTINSPMVGTFYTAPSPTHDPFVKVGDKVSTTSVVCIIEAMKVMNEITADIEGEILELLVGNGETVEYGQALFTVRPQR